MLLMLPSVHDQKRQLRRRCKSIRKGLSNETRLAGCRAICEQLAAWDIFQSVESILTYMPIPTEVDLGALLSEYPHKRWLLPRIIPGKDGRMVFHSYDPDNLVVHPFGMAEPAAHLLQVPPDEIQLVLAPGLAFDRSGWRLGYGGGYFDRFLKDFSGVSVGVVYRDLLLNTIPHGRYDIPMDWLVTEDGLFRVSKS